MTIILFILILGVLIFVHELGHFLTAKKFGIRVDEFGLGFPPRLISRRRGETEYSLNILPLGGFVKIFGENPDEESLGGPDRRRSLTSQPRWVQALVLVAGVGFNLIFAWLLISVGFMAGLPTPVESRADAAFSSPAKLVIAQVMSESPAAGAGLQIGDELVYLKVGKQTSPTGDQLTPEAVGQFVVQYPEEEITVGYRRGQIFAQKLSPLRTTTMVPQAGILADQPAIGIGTDRIAVLKLSPLPALWEGLKLTAQLTYLTVTSLIDLIARAIQGQGSFAQVTGPIGLVSLVGSAAHLGWIYLLNFTAFISINLAVINLAPFPALDGGRLLFLLIEKIKGSIIKPAVANIVNLAGFALLIILMLVVTYHDIIKLF
ncbi:MAG: RIP metalloprotease RseP [Patescibacteria group bacterium]|nr:RIP metalloprotease RseP [Patescibacteria group bacterium]